jgi:hypothetical protein
MRYKIQFNTFYGWTDLKYQEDNLGDYKVDLFETEIEAENELKSILTEFDEKELYRIVKEDVKEETNNLHFELQ